MSKFKFSALISAICLMSIFLYTIVGFSQTPQPTVKLVTKPPLSQIHPFEAEATTPQSPALLTLLAVDSKSLPLANAKIHLTILTPPKNPWFSTDFPIVEGTKLLEMEAIAPKGELQIQQLLPIRGTYQLLVNVTPMVANAFTAIQQTLTLSVPENGVKYRNFGILAVILLFVGLGGGLVIGLRQQIQPGEIAPQQVRLLLSGLIVLAIAALLYVNVSAEIAESGMGHAHAHSTLHTEKTDNSGIVQSQGLSARLLGDTSATVGQAASLEVQVIDTQTNQPATDVLLNVKATQLEDEWIAFAYKAVPDSKGQLKWLSQFFDGAPHSIEVEVSPQPNAPRQFKPFQVKRKIEVEGIAPPLYIRLIALTYLTGIVVFGLLMGLGIQRRRRQRVSHTRSISVL
jgi:hypothetical protein